MSDKPEDPTPPELPEAWKKPADPNWKPGQPTNRAVEPNAHKKAIWTVLGVLGVVFIGIPVLSVLVLLGTCFLGGRV